MPDLHHVGVVVSDLDRSVDFYGGLLGLPRSTPTEDPEHAARSAAFGTGDDATPRLLLVARPGLEQGRPGAGALHHTAFSVATREALLRWKRRLRDAGVRVTGPLPRLHFFSIYFDDPDGATIELATVERNASVQLDPDPETGLVLPPDEFLAGGRDEAEIDAESWPEPVPDVTPDMRIEGVHHVSALTTELDRVAQLLTGGVGLTLVLRTINHDFAAMPHYFFGDPDGRPGTLVTYFGNPGRGRLKPARRGTGSWNHVALRLTDRAALAAAAGRLDALGCIAPAGDDAPLEGVRFEDPDGLPFELVAPD